MMSSNCFKLLSVRQANLVHHSFKNIDRTCKKLWLPCVLQKRFIVCNLKKYTLKEKLLARSCCEDSSLKVGDLSSDDTTGLEYKISTKWGTNFGVDANAALAVSQAYSEFILDNFQHVQWEKLEVYFNNKENVKYWPIPLLTYIGQFVDPVNAEIIAVSLLNYMKQNENLNSILKTRLFSTVYFFCVSRNTAREDEILSFISSTTDQYRLDRISAVLIAKICNNLTANVWKEVYQHPSLLQLCHKFLRRALREKEYRHAIEICMTKEAGPSLIPQTLMNWNTKETNLLTEAVEHSEFMTHLFDVLRNKQWFFHEHQALQFCDSLNDHEKEWEVTQTKLDERTGQCENCGYTFPEMHLSEDQFSTLQSLFLKKTVIRKDVFIISSPVELKRFERFISKVGKVDVVIDGLNVLYRKRRVNNVLPTLVDHLVEKMGYKVMVIAKHHAKYKKLFNMKEIEDKVPCFYTNDESADDAFFLYAALKSGPGTCVVSNDFMRAESVLLGKEYRKVFKLWQRLHQIRFTEDGKTLTLELPEKFDIRTEYNENRFHVPYSDVPINEGIEKFPSTLLCGHKKET